MRDDLKRERPLVSIIVPTYNCGETLECVIQELFSQDYQPFEILIGDNASTDNTFEVALKISKRFDNVRVFRNVVNLGAVKNIQNLVYNTRGSLVFIRACGDNYSSNYLSEMVEIHLAHSKCVLVLPCIKIVCKDEILYSINSPDIQKGIIKRYWFTLVNFPSVGFYGVYKREHLMKCLPLGATFGSDLILISALSVEGIFKSTSKATYFFHTREERNSKSQDINFFFGDEGYKKILRPGFDMIRGRIWSIADSGASRVLKLMLYSLVFVAFIRETFLKVFLILLKCLMVSPDKFASFWTGIYMKFFAISGTKVVNSDEFWRVEVIGKLRLRRNT